MSCHLKYTAVAAILGACFATTAVAQTAWYNEQHRPQVHFTPQKGWMNDPNGMVYYNNTYHLFYQYYPDSTVWGPMHWAHATSSDLVHWQHQPIALYPDSQGYIFSGSAVADLNNTSGFGKEGKTPLVAIFTQHDPKSEKAGRDNYENESIAYSLDNGSTWTKYAGNPVLKNPGIRDFRDPKVSWYPKDKKWIMTLATHDRVSFYSSPNLKDWKKESEFGNGLGAHGGVWECPDLFWLDYRGEQVWVLIVNINPGGPNGGSATQYFMGKFDGRRFTPFQTDTRWVDYGPDDYAGVTWAGTGRRKIFLGWMSNWQYATVVPTAKWRSAMTVPRELTIEKAGGKYLLRSRPAPELKALEEKLTVMHNLAANRLDLTAKTGKIVGPARLDLNTGKLESFSIRLSNSKGQYVVIGYDKQRNDYFIDRAASGETGFNKDFAIKHSAPRFSSQRAMDLTLMIDNASVELFADGGLTVMTEIFFPDEPFADITIQSDAGFHIKKLQFAGLKSVYKNSNHSPH